MGKSQINPSYAFAKFVLEHKRIITIRDVLKDLDIETLAKDLGFTISEMDSLIKNPSRLRFETVYQLSLLFDCDYKKLVKLIADYTLKKKHTLPKKGQ